MNIRRAGVAAAVVAVLGLTVQTLPEIAVGLLTDPGNVPSWLPAFGTLGRTVLVYSTLSHFVGPLVTVAFAVGLGYALGRRFDLVRDYRSLVAAVSVGSVGGVLCAVASVGVALALLGSSSGALGVSGASVLALDVFRYVVTVSLVTIVGVVAGATVPYVEAHRSSPARPVGADARPSNRDAGAGDADRSDPADGAR